MPNFVETLVPGKIMSQNVNRSSERHWTTEIRKASLNLRSRDLITHFKNKMRVMHENGVMARKDAISGKMYS